MLPTQTHIYEATVRRVVDGDTLDLNVNLGFGVSIHLRVRLYGIDTYEIHGVKKHSDEWEKGMAAKQFVEEYLGLEIPSEHNHPYFVLNPNPIIIRSYNGKAIKKGKYGRWLVEIYVPNKAGSIGARTLNEALVNAGHTKQVSKYEYLYSQQHKAIETGTTKENTKKDNEEK